MSTTNIESLLKDVLFQEGFKDDETPLDEYTLNKLTKAIKALKTAIDTTASNVYTKEESDDKFETIDYVNVIKGIVDSLDIYIADETRIRESLNKYITGDNEILSADTSGKYANSNAQLREDIDDANDSIEEIEKSLSELAGSLSDESTTREEYDEILEHALAKVVGKSIEEISQLSTPYGNSTERLRAELDALKGNVYTKDESNRKFETIDYVDTIWNLVQSHDSYIEELYSGNLVVDGMGVPAEVLQGDTSWDGSHDGNWTF